MSLVPTREDEAFGAGYRQASEAGGRVIDHFSKRLTEVEVQRDALVKALQEIENTAEGHQCRIKARAALVRVGSVKDR